MNRPFLLAALLALPAFCAAEPAAVRSSQTLTEAQVMEELAKEPAGNAGTYGQATSYLRKHAADEERMTLLANSIARTNPGLAQAISGAGGGALDSGKLKAFFKDPSSNGAAALLVDASRNESTRQSMVAKYSKLKADGKVQDFDTFLTYLAKDKDGPDTIHRILTEMSERPKAPRAEDDQQRPGNPPGGPKKPKVGKGSPADIERLNRTYWNADEMYGAAGDPNVLSLGGRVIAFNIVSVKGADGSLSHMLTVYDRTDPNDVHGRSFKLDDAELAKGLKFKMDDRQGSTHADEYTIQLVPDASGKDHKIVFKGDAGSAPADFPTVNGLFIQRAQKVLDYGYVVKVGPKEFYLGGEGHSGTGQNTFWDPEKLKEMLEKAKKGEVDPRTALSPDMAVTSVQFNKDSKKFEPLERSSIGQVEGKWYDLVWNKEKGVLEVAEGQKPPAPGENPPPGTPGTPPGGDKDWPDLEHPQLKIRLSVSNSDVAGINAKLKAAGLNVRIYSCSPAQKLLDQYFLAAKSGDQVPNIRIPYVGGGNSAFKGFDLLGNSVLAVRDAAGTRYFDLKRIPESFQDVWFVANDKKSFSVGANETAVRDALAQSGADSAAAAAVMENLGKAGAGKALIVFSKGGEKVFAEFENRKIYQVWPKLELDPSSGRPDDVDRPGTGHALDQLGGGTQTAELPGDRTDINGKPSTVVKAGQGAKLFKVTEDNKSSYFGYVTIQTPQGPYRYGPKLMFQDPADVRDKFPGADKVTVQGVVLSGPKPEDGELKFGPKPDGNTPLAEKGIWAIWHGEKAGRSTNCLGVVAYWGMSATEADALCRRK